MIDISIPAAIITIGTALLASLITSAAVLWLGVMIRRPGRRK